MSPFQRHSLFWPEMSNPFPASVELQTDPARRLSSRPPVKRSLRSYVLRISSIMPSMFPNIRMFSTPDDATFPMSRTALRCRSFSNQSRHPCWSNSRQQFSLENRASPTGSQLAPLSRTRTPSVLDAQRSRLGRWSRLVPQDPSPRPRPATEP
jgi:hypothetical protein